jgi:hypothetical protein
MAMTTFRVVEDLNGFEDIAECFLAVEINLAAVAGAVRSCPFQELAGDALAECAGTQVPECRDELAVALGLAGRGPVRGTAWRHRTSRTMRTKKACSVTYSE